MSETFWKGEPVETLHRDVLIEIARQQHFRIEVLKAALVDICELVDGYEDVDDGQPNLAMRVMTTAVAALEPTPPTKGRLP